MVEVGRFFKGNWVFGGFLEGAVVTQPVICIFSAKSAAKTGKSSEKSGKSSAEGVNIGIHTSSIGWPGTFLAAFKPIPLGVIAARDLLARCLGRRYTPHKEGGCPARPARRDSPLPLCSGQRKRGHCCPLSYFHMPYFLCAVRRRRFTPSCHCTRTSARAMKVGTNPTNTCSIIRQGLGRESQSRQKLLLSHCKRRAGF